MAKQDSIVLRDLFTVALSIHRQYPGAGSDAEGYMQMYVTEASSLRAAVAQCRQFVALHGGEPEAFPGGDVWLDGEQLVFAVGHGDGQDARFHEVAAGEFKRFFPRASGNYRMIEETGEWRLITRGSLISRTA